MRQAAIKYRCGGIRRTEIDSEIERPIVHWSVLP
jgi:hypothetical protein